MGVINVHNNFYQRLTIAMMVYRNDDSLQYDYIMYKTFESPVKKFYIN